MLSIADKKRLYSLRLKKSRDRSGSFLIEGPHLVNECLNSPYTIKHILIKKDKTFPESENILDIAKSKKIEVEYLQENEINKISVTETPQGILAEVLFPENTNMINYNTDLIVALDRINDPGNLGTIIRTCYWFGVRNVIIAEESADIYNQKVLRSSQGAVFHLNISYDIDLIKELNSLSENGFKIFISDLNTENYIDNIKFNVKNVLVFGNEASGVSSVLKEKYEKIKIPSYSECESLNVAASVGIFLYEFRKNS